MLTELGTGLIKITLASGFDTFIATSGGFLQVTREKVIILADTAELSEEIDVERARADAEAARQRLAAPGINAEEVRQELEEALNRVRVAQLHSH
jgi:F-type H+-transporting ATPase subunit epsilon